MKGLTQIMGQITVIRIKDAKGVKRKIKAGDVKYMYLAPSVSDKLGKVNSYLSDASQWQSTDLDKDIIKKGYVYFEQAQLKMGKKSEQGSCKCLTQPFVEKSEYFMTLLPKKPEVLALEESSLQVVWQNLIT